MKALIVVAFRMKIVKKVVVACFMLTGMCANMYKRTLITEMMMKKKKKITIGFECESCVRRTLLSLEVWWC